MNRFDFTPYRRSMVGFDRLFDMLENQGRAQSGDNYPPFNIEKRGDDAYRITLAVAGFKSADIDITAQQNLLVVQAARARTPAATTCTSASPTAASSAASSWPTMSASTAPISRTACW